MALLESNGDVAERYEYDAYGEPRFYDADFVLLATQASGYNNPIMFTGQRLDRLDSGDLILVYYKNRYYDPGTGRWLTKDPLGFRARTWMGQSEFSPIKQYADGANLYLYVGCAPSKLFDPWGMQSSCCGKGGVTLSTGEFMTDEEIFYEVTGTLHEMSALYIVKDRADFTKGEFDSGVFVSLTPEPRLEKVNIGPKKAKAVKALEGRALDCFVLGHRGFLTLFLITQPSIAFVW